MKWSERFAGLFKVLIELTGSDESIFKQNLGKAIRQLLSYSGVRS